MKANLTALLLAVLSALLSIACFPRLDQSILAWGALVPLLLAIRGRSPTAAYGFGFVAGFVFFAGFFHWIWAVPGFNVVDFFLLQLYFPHYFGVFASLVALITGRTGLPLALVAPPIWVCLEYVRAHFFFLALPMGMLGHSQHGQVALIQIAAWSGVYGVSFLIVIVNAVLADALADQFGQGWRHVMTTRTGRRRLAQSASLVAVLVAVPTMLGALAVGRTSSDAEVTVGVVQRNIPPGQMGDRRAGPPALDRYIELSREAAGGGAAVVVWPETAIPGPSGSSGDGFLAAVRAAKTVQSYLVFGVAGADKFSGVPPRRGERFNSALLLSPQGRVEGVYHKIRLVPFGEYLPLKDVFTWPAFIVSKWDDMTPGSELTVFRIPSATFGVVICWETLFPELFRAIAQRGPQFMVNITNEVWFGETVVPYHLLAISVFRAVENRMAVIRAANGGLSAFIDKYGRVTGLVQPRDRRMAFQEGAMRREVSLSGERTFYTRYGDVFVLACFAATALMLVRAMVPVHCALRDRGEAHGA